MGLVQQWKEFRQYQKEDTMTLEDILLKSGLINENVTKQEALNIPALASCVEIITSTIAHLPIMLYKDNNGKVEIVNDNRVRLLNDDTGDTLDGNQFKKALIEDYLLDGVGYAHINRDGNKVKSLHYVENNNVSVNVGVDPIMKDYDLLVNGETYRPHQFLKVTRKTKDGVTGEGIVQENNKILSVAYHSLLFEEILVKTGGNRKGFLKSDKKLSQDAINNLKTAWSNLYKNNSESVAVLNEGMDFKEVSNTSVEMQLNENKKTNAAEICKLFKLSPSILEGNVTEDQYNIFIKMCILPILTAIETALNKDLLLPSEKESFYFEFQKDELLKGDILKRFQAYSLALRDGVYQIDEVRYKENLEPLGLEFIKLGLQDVLYNPKTKEIYTPNTNKSTNIDEADKMLEGGENNEN